MKHLILLVLLLAVAQIGFSQNNPNKKAFSDDIYFSTPKMNQENFNTRFNTSDYTEFEWLQKNIAAYHKQRKLAMILSIAGTTATTAAIFMDNKDAQNITFAVGGTISLSAFVTFWDADKYLKRIALFKPRQ